MSASWRRQGDPRVIAERGHPIDELEELCRRAVSELGLLGSAVSLMSTAGSEAVAAVSDEATRGFEKLQFDLGEGPGREAYAAGRPVLISDLVTAVGRWPGYAPTAREAGVEAVFAFPLQLGASRFGVLTLYSALPRALDAEELTACFALVEAATDALLNGETGTGARGAGTLPGPLRFRSEVFQAQGMVMVDLGVPLADALARMRAHAYATGMDLDRLALEIIAGRTRLEHGDPP